MLSWPEKDVWERLQHEKRPLLLYGMGNGGDLMLHQLALIGKTINGVFASPGFSRGQCFHGFPVQDFEEAKAQFPDALALIAFGSSRPEVMQYARSLPMEALAPEVPVAGTQVFTLAFAQNHRQEIENVYECLADETSRRVFETVFAYKLTGDFRSLEKAESSEEDLWQLLNPGREERFLDLGAYNGDTVREFARHAKTWQSITAWEPDPKTFRKLMKNTEDLPNVTCLNAAAGAEDGTVIFEAGESRASRIMDESHKDTHKLCESVQMNKYAVDGTGAYSLIKVDVEGAEDAVLSGAEQQIRKGATLRVAAYHRAEDLFALPLHVLRLRPDEKIYLRHRPALLAWDTDWIFKSPETDER